MTMNLEKKNSIIQIGLKRGSEDEIRAESSKLKGNKA